MYEVRVLSASPARSRAGENSAEDWPMIGHLIAAFLDGTCSGTIDETPKDVIPQQPKA